MTFKTIKTTGLIAAVFDLDGVITFTARVHAAAWKELFDEYLRSRAAQSGEPFQAFDLDADYHRFVDGRPRYEGVSSFLHSRGIQLPLGRPSDPPDRETIYGLGNRKNAFFRAKLQEVGVEVDCKAVRFVHELLDRKVRVGLASSSQNAVPVLDHAGLRGLFEAIIDGKESERLGLHGKPQPDIFLTCLKKLGEKIAANNAMVVEDALSGVEAGRRGGFGLVLGIDRSSQAAALREHGAHRVIHDFGEISADQVLEYFLARTRSADSTH